MYKKIISKIKNRLETKGGVFKSISILVGGTTFAQLLTIMSLPIVTRLYTPDQFAIFAIYMSIFTIFSVICCLRFDVAISLSQDNREAVALSIIALLSNIVFIIVLCVIIFFFKSLLQFIGKGDILPYIFYLPVGVFLAGLFSVFQYWSIRRKEYILIAKTSIFQSGIGIFIQVSAALLGYGVTGLIVGQIAKSSIGILKLARNFWQDCFIFAKEEQEKLKSLYLVFRKNIEFPKYSVVDTLANTASIQLPIMMIALLSTNAEAGLLMLAIQLLSIPITFIGKAVSQVYLAEAPIKVQNNEINIYTINLLDYLMCIGVNILFVIGIISPFFTEHIFGQQWAGMGIMISWMIPWFTLQLISSPISMIMYIVGKQKQILILTLFGLLFKTISIAVQYFINPEYLVQNFAISNAIFYAIACVIFCKYAQVSVLSIVNLIKKNTPGHLLVISSILMVLFILNSLGLS